MGLEATTYINGLIATNPTGTDPQSQGDDHLRLLKSTIKNTFPNITGVVTPTQAEINILTGGLTSADITNTPAGNITSTNQQDVNNELDGLIVTGIQSGTVSSAIAAGTAAIITATFSPVPTLVDMMQFNVRASGANTVTGVTFNPNGLGALRVYKKGGTALAVGDIAAAGHELILRYRSSPARYELINYAAGGAIIASQATVNTGTNNTEAVSPLTLRGAITTCKAWVNFNGTGTVAIRSSFKVSSITDNGVGDYTVNFTNNVTDAKYSTTISHGRSLTSAANGFMTSYNHAVGSVRLSTTTTTNTAVDFEQVSITIHGN